jgi:hypothetical protein
MKIIILSILFIAGCNDLLSQKVGDRKIIVKLSDTSNIYIRVKLAIIKAGYTVKDDMNYQLLTSNVEVKKKLGYTIVKAEIKNDTVVVWGFYNNKNKNLYGIDMAQGKYTNISYYKNNEGHGWDILHAIASEIDAHDLTYSK